MLLALAYIQNVGGVRNNIWADNWVLEFAAGGLRLSFFYFLASNLTLCCYSLCLFISLFIYCFSFQSTIIDSSFSVLSCMSNFIIVFELSVFASQCSLLLFPILMPSSISLVSSLTPLPHGVLL